MGTVIVVTACFRAETGAIGPRDGVRILHTRMGARAAGDLTRAVAAGDRVSLLLSTGFCGGLAPELRLGDLVIASETRSGGEAVRVDPALIERARAALDARGLSPRIGAVECAEGVLAAARKRELAARGGISVDLETGPLAGWSAAHGIPFLSCRVVLDAVDEELPFSGRVPLWASVARHPLAAARAGRSAAVAARRIGVAVDCLLDAWEEAR